MELKDLSSNWRKLQESLKSNSKPTASPSTKRKRSDHATSSTTTLKKRPKTSAYAEKRLEKQANTKKRKRGAMSTEEVGDVTQNTITLEGAPETNGHTHSTTDKLGWEGKVNEGLSPTAKVVKYLAIDCEMVGVGPNPDHDSALARVSIVNYNGEQVYDSFVLPKEQVTDWRTHVSGVTSKHMAEARSLETVQADVSELMDGNILVGHAVRNDLDALMLSHPKPDIRDTSRHPPFRKVAGGGSPRLKILAAEFLGLNIQGGQHSSVEDARATMLLFRHDKTAFDREHAKKYPSRVVTATDKDQEDGGKSTKKKKKPKKKKGRK
ncbi:3'-5' exonuclease [Arachnomyces sp. PD_36]|nr:3'-5' exonuclease [Arachnomyces sp. PD_36]